VGLVFYTLARVLARWCSTGKDPSRYGGNEFLLSFVTENGDPDDSDPCGSEEERARVVGRRSWREIRVVPEGGAEGAAAPGPQK
jgi:hypothetical protein